MTKRTRILVYSILLLGLVYIMYSCGKFSKNIRLEASFSNGLDKHTIYDKNIKEKFDEICSDLGKEVPLSKDDFIKAEFDSNIRSYKNRLYFDEDDIFSESSKEIYIELNKVQYLLKAESDVVGEYTDFIENDIKFIEKEKND